MEEKREIGFQVRTLSHLIKRMADQTVFPEEVAQCTGMHGWMIGYLYENQDREIFQRDIQERFMIRRSTVTGILQLMEKNGLITRTPVQDDARLKRIQLTPKAIKLHQQVRAGIREMERRLSQNLTEAEKETFFMLCEKIKAGIEEE